VMIKRVLVVYKKSSFQLYVKVKGDDSLQRALSRGDPVAQRMLDSHDTLQRSAEKLERSLAARSIEFVSRWRGRIRSTRGFDLVISLGGDGTLLETAHWLGSCPLLGINSDPTNSVGELCAGTADEIDQILDALLADKIAITPRTRMQVCVDGQSVLGPVLNDLLIAERSPADMARFQLTVMPQADIAQKDATQILELSSHTQSWHEVRSSGLWIATATGSTAGIRSAGGEKRSHVSTDLQYLVREHYAPPSLPRAERIHGFLETDETLVLISRMRSACVWADGPHRKVRVRYGQVVSVEDSAPPLLLVGTFQDRSQLT